jgi:uncharacterized protein YdaU (DUF1376 family)
MSFAFLPFYTGDYFRDTRGLSMAAHGCYFLLLTYCWDSKGPVPLDLERVAGICEARSQEERATMQRILQTYFVQMGDGWYNGRMQKVVERAEAISRERSKAGRQGYEAKAKHLPSKRQASASNPNPTTTTEARSKTETRSKTLIDAGASLPAELDLGGSTAKPELPPTKAQRARDPEAKTGPIWSAYAGAYRERYGVDPVRNARVNKQLSGVVDRVGVEAAPAVAVWYVRHSRSLYASSKHCTDLLLRDCEGLHTEMRTGRAVTDTAARQADRVGTMRDVVEQVKREGIWPTTK